jgi:hypothetical protein
MPTKHATSELIAVLSNGDFDARSTAELDKVVEAVEAGHGTGKIVITIAVKKEGRMLVLKPSVKATIPVAATDSSMFFVSKEGRLTDEDPAQLVLAHVPKRPGKLVDLDANRPAPAGSDNDPTKKGS